MMATSGTGPHQRLQCMRHTCLKLAPGPFWYWGKMEGHCINKHRNGSTGCRATCTNSTNWCWQLSGANQMCRNKDQL